MSQSTITIGLVVRNGERHIGAAIDSFRKQTRSDFTLVVHDNASTDHTVAIVREFMQRDARIQLSTRSENVGVVRNLIDAAEQARTPLFCWAACDDVREPAFLERLAALLEGDPEAALACCAVRNIDPDGTPREVRTETSTLRTSAGMSALARLRVYSVAMPGTPFYGLFRTEALQSCLPVLREIDARSAGNGPLLGLDMIFLARVLRDFGLAYIDQPLLQFRRGGISHDHRRFGSLHGLLRQVWMFDRALKRSFAVPRASLLLRASLSILRMRAMMRWLCSRETRALFAPYLQHSLGFAQPLMRAWSMHFDSNVRRLRHRVRSLPRSARIVIFGAGKHTHRRYAELSAAIGRHATIVAICDDRARECHPIAGLPLIMPDAMHELSPDVVLVSSDAYECAMVRRALEIAPPDTGARVWCLYNVALEVASPTDDEAAPRASSASTSAMNIAVSASASPVMAAAR